MGRCCSLLVALGVIAAPSALTADDYTLAAGESDTLSVAATYDTMTVNGDLTVTGGKTINVNTINMAGGSITVTEADTTLGVSHGTASTPTSSMPTFLSMTNGADGAYGKLNVIGTGVAADEGLAVTMLNIRAEGEDFVSDNGYFDLMSLSNGTANFFGAYNYSSATGRIVVAGTSAIYRRTARYSGGIFRKGAFQVRLVDNATLTFNFSAQGGNVNASGCVVDVCGTGTARLLGSYEGTSYAASVNKGAVFNHVGPLDFIRADSKRHCYFALNDSGVIGPNVTALRQTSGASSYNTQISIASGATITLCGDVRITGARAYLTGGRIKIDATDAARSFKCHINANDSLVVEKVGANEMVVSSTTNIPNLVVNEGVVRFATNDCVVGKLTIASGAEVIADGCVVTLADGEYVGAALRTANGGSFAKTGAERTVIYDPASVTGVLHVANGELAFSKYGFDQKWWRWTFFSVNNGPHALMHRGLYLYGTDGTRQSGTPSYDSTAAKFDAPPSTALGAGKCRWWRHSTTSIVASTSYTYCKNSYLPYWFEYSHAGNNLATLSSPVIDPEDPASYVGVEVHIPNTAKPIIGYNMRTHHKTYYANGWKLEASSDGLDWETVEVRSNQTFTISDTYYSYDNVAYVKNSDNNKEFFHFTGYRNGGLAAVDPLSVQVDDGATLDLLAFDDGQPVEAITIDLAAGGGTMKGGKIMPNGVLNIENATGATPSEPLPIVFEDTLDTENFASWSVVVNGRRRRATIIYEGSRLRLQLTGLVIFVL